MKEKLDAKAKTHMHIIIWFRLICELGLAFSRRSQFQIIWKHFDWSWLIPELTNDNLLLWSNSKYCHFDFVSLLHDFLQKKTIIWPRSPVYTSSNIVKDVWGSFKKSGNFPSYCGKIQPNFLKLLAWFWANLEKIIFSTRKT